jgi:hypothetical protein
MVESAPWLPIDAGGEPSHKDEESDMRFAKSLGLLLGLVLLPLSGNVLAGPTAFYFDLAGFQADHGASAILVEDFESVFPKDTALPSFTSNGITYTGTQASSPNVWVASPGYTNFGVPVTTSSVLTANGPEDFRLDLSVPATAIGFDIYYNGVETVNLAFYDENSFNFASMSSGAAAGIGFMGFSSDTPITRVTFHSTGGERINTGIDNVRMVPIPAPGAALLGMIGATLVGWFRRRIS